MAYNCNIGLPHIVPLCQRVKTLIPIVCVATPPTRWQVVDPTARAVLQTEGADLCQIQDGVCLQLQGSGGATEGRTRHRAQHV